MMQFLRHILLALLILTGITSSVRAQFGHEWIDYSLTYYKFPVVQDGLHRISYQSLQDAGFPMATDPRAIRIYGFGREVPLFIQGEQDGLLNPGDYIEFYGRKNDGIADSVLYMNFQQSSKALSLFNDTIYYFLTVVPSITGNLRFTQETDVNTAGYAAAPYYTAKIRNNYTNTYNSGSIYIGNTLDPRYTDGEGYGWINTGDFAYSQPWNGFVANLQPTMYTAGPPARMFANIAGASDPTTNNLFDHRYIIDFGGNIKDTSTMGFAFCRISMEAAAAAVAAGTNAFVINYSNFYSGATRNSLSYIELHLPQVYNLSGRTRHTMYIPDNPNASKYTVNISNFNTLGSTVRMYDLTNRRRIPVNVSGTSVSAVIPDGNGEKQVYISTDSLTLNVSDIRKIRNPNGTNGLFRDFTSTVKNFDYLIITHKSLWNSAVSYAAYRNLTGYNSLVLDVEELTDQFAWGIRNHPRGIYQFLKYTWFNWDIKPRMVFFIGKGYRTEFTRSNNTLFNLNLVPAIGNPPTDNMYTYNLSGTGRVDIPTGRLSAANPSDVDDYLSKVMQHESNPRDVWMKRVLHFGGGYSLQEQNILANYLNSYKDIIEDTLYGGTVRTVLKSTNAPLLSSVADSIRTLINGGVSLMTFFGHASGSGFDTNIDEPSEYNNTGKYPMILANSCYSGDLFQNYPSVSEKFVLEKQKGSIGFISSISASLSPFLAFYSYEWYKSASWRLYNHPVGDIMKQASDTSISNGALISLFTALEMSLHGDPAVRLNTTPKPDLLVTEPQIYILPTAVTTDIDSFMVKVVILNIGRSTTDSVQVELRRKYPLFGKSDDVYLKTLAPVIFSDTAYFKLPTDPVNGQGLNLLTVTADPADLIDEMTNTNNTAVKQLNISQSDIVPVYPRQFAVIPKNSTWLKASTGDPFAPVRTYKFEIDTTDLFNSPFKRDTVITQSGGVVKWKPSLLLTDSTVYFWRTGVDSTGSSGVFNKWKESSFQYITGKSGWGQDHFFQFKNDNFLYIDYNRPERRFDYSPNLKQLKCQTQGVPPNIAAISDCLYQMDGVLQEYGACGLSPAIHIAVIDPITLEAWGNRYGGANPDHYFGNANDNGSCRQRVEKFFIFRPWDNASRNSLRDMLNNGIPTGHYVLAWTMFNSQFQNFTPDQLQAFTNLGADTITYMAQTALDRPYIFFARKGFPETAQEVLGQAQNTQISLAVTLQNDWTFGTIVSPLIGPSKKWNSFHWRQFAMENPPLDSASVTITGIKFDGTSVPLINGLQPAIADIPNLYDSINAAVYPYIRLSMFSRDDSLRTPAQLDRWHVLYDAVPEAALNPSIAYTFSSDTLQQGRTLKFATAIENIGDYPMDSLTVKYFIYNQNNQLTQWYKKLDSLRLDSYLIDTFTVANNAYPGLNSLWIEANPFEQHHQLEQYHFNNLGQKVFYTRVDKINPVLDVTFDGVRIMNGELVSAKPDIVIRLKDENKFLLLNDTANFELYLKGPLDNQPKRLNFGMSDITFTPAQNAQNTCKIEYRPDYTAADGTYELRVRAKDASNNQSGKGDGVYDYTISFQVINRQTITEVLNYPNPFSTSTRFVFTLTGSEIPTFMKIQILTTDGKVVREILMHELGPVRIGKNITEYAWDGTDEFGDKLASGVYLYRVITQMNGENVEKSSTSADKFFKKGWGKMYLMR